MFLQTHLAATYEWFSVTMFSDAAGGVSYYGFAPPI